MVDATPALLFFAQAIGITAAICLTTGTVILVVLNVSVSPAALAELYVVSSSGAPLSASSTLEMLVLDSGVNCVVVPAPFASDHPHWGDGGAMSVPPLSSSTYRSSAYMVAF